ncbi:uncharacterized protein LOC118755749 [Rhagoletis pomonella]|uniref:uncharacterized protein LOC118755749 n=1 Tax=Rhagoletis pomonella TaxID=28610 RepID=UPI00177E1AF2|nr:uncharacterized protein LOC118755749 [Rhagoletis pomonella]
MERRFHNNAQLKQEHQKFMFDYITLGHMEPAGNFDPKRTYFLPHHAVLKPNSTTTKLRVVFDGSCRTTNGLSLNDQLLVGPTIQRDLFDIILNFRKYKLGFTGDIEKMYRQILVDPDDQSLQRILWRRSNDEPIKEYNLKTVTYGTSAAPFLATRTLKQIANDNANAHPKASEAISQYFYVDDFMASATDEATAIQLKEEICALLFDAGLHLRKWSSNSATFLESIPSEDREVQSDTCIDSTCTVKTLGLLWDTSTDSFKYSVCLPSNQHTTKRSVLSDLARVFDPIGWLSPVVISMKIFMQKLWLRGIGWDEALPHDLYTQWVEYRESINRILQLHIPRWIRYSNEKLVQLHGFADSSELAYAATIYIRVHHENGQISTNLIAAKTRVAPVKQITLPRLELCGSHLMTKLMTKVQNALELSKAETFGWTDSTIVLAWLRDHPRRWKTFIANRTAEILKVVPSERWRHIPSQHNPADLATRGLCPQELLSNEIWWHGPGELKDIPETCHLVPPLEDDITQEERKSTVALASVTTEVSVIERYSCYTRLLRITSLLLRFVNNCKAKCINSKGNNQSITTSELRTAHDVLVRSAQAGSYTFELRTIGQGRQLPSSHKLAPLAPFIDEQGLLRVGDRVTNAKINYNQKHPFIMDKTHPLTKLIVRDYHIRYLHAGHRQLHYLLALKYWIPGVTYVIKQCIFKCTVCMRHRGISYQQQMGDIPKYRLDPGSPFLNTGIDFAGPIQVRSWKGRGSKLYKCWIALFICLTTKAIHIELVTELSTAAFIASLRRFTARRGKPLHIFSDNGTNFVGANQHLRELYQYINDSTTQETISRASAEQEIQWHFSPPAGPHFGGIWEAGVKSVKYHLKRTLADASVTYEELNTILCQIEGCLNSRPLCTKFEGDIDPLTPAHFLIMRPMTSLPDKNLLNLKENAVNRWQYLQKLTQHFWKRWSIEYVTQLQQRPKWSQRLRNLEINDVVIIKDDNLPPTQWSIGKISKVHPGSDGLVRVASVDTFKGTLKRPIVKLCPLFIDI